MDGISGGKKWIKKVDGKVHEIKEGKVEIKVHAKGKRKVDEKNEWKSARKN